MLENIHESKNYENFKQGLYAKNMTTWTNLCNIQQAQVDTDKFMKIKFFLAEMKVNFWIMYRKEKGSQIPSSIIFQLPFTIAPTNVVCCPS